MRKLLNAALITLLAGVLAFSSFRLVDYLNEEVTASHEMESLYAIYSGQTGTVGLTMNEQNEMSANDPMFHDVPTAVTTDSVVPGIADDSETIVDVDEDQFIADEGDPIIDEDTDTENPGASQYIGSGIAQLHRQNADCIAWIHIDGTVIDYPVMYRPHDKGYYLHRDFNGKKSSAGSLYVAENCNPDSSDNTIIYGHHMNSGRMFAALVKYKQKTFFEKHRYIDLDTLHGFERYEVMFAFTTPVYTGHDFAYYAFTNAATEKEFNTFIAECQKRSLYNTGNTARYGDKLLTLTTCEYSQKNGRMVIVAKRVPSASERSDSNSNPNQ